MKEESRLQFKRIAPAALHALKEALTNIYWYKPDLRSFLTHTINEPRLLSKLNWEDYKRNIVSELVEYLASHEDIFQRQLLQLMSEVVRINDYSHLERIDDGKNKAKRAKEAVNALRELMGGLDKMFYEETQIEKRRQESHEKLITVKADKGKLENLKDEYLVLISSHDKHGRGYQLEKILRELFELFDLDPKASFKIIGEQIDGAFSFDGTDYLLEAKWQKEQVGADDLDVLAGKLRRKLENALGLFISVNGYTDNGVLAHSSGRRLIILMDGSDLMAVLEARIDLVQLLLRKRREASQTGNIYLRIHEILI